MSLLSLTLLLTACVVDRDGDGLIATRDCDDLDPDVGYDIYEGTIDSDWQALCAEATCLREIQGDLILYNDTPYDATPEDVASLSCLGSITGHFQLHQNEAIKNLNGLENLETVGGWFELRGYGPLVLDGLSGLKKVGVLDLYESKMKSLQGLENLEEITGDLRIANTYYLNDISALYASLQSVGNDIAIINNASLCQSNVDKLIDSLDEIGRNVTTHNNECASP